MSLLFGLVWTCQKCPDVCELYNATTREYWMLRKKKGKKRPLRGWHYIAKSSSDQQGGLGAPNIFQAGKQIRFPVEFCIIFKAMRGKPLKGT